MVALPVIKLETLALKTFCKPIANCLAKEAICHPKFRQYIVNFAQAKHRLKRRVQRRIYDDYAGDDVPIQPLDEDKAVGAGADLLREFFVFTVAGATVIFEVLEARKKEERSRLKEERRRQENELLRQGLQLIQEQQLRQELQHRQETELLRQELQAINLKQNFFEHEKKLEIKQLATFAFILILMHTHGNEGRKSKSN